MGRQGEVTKANRHTSRVTCLETASPKPGPGQATSAQRARQQRNDSDEQTRGTTPRIRHPAARQPALDRANHGGGHSNGGLAGGMHIGTPATLDTLLVTSGRARTRQPSRICGHRSTTGCAPGRGTDISGCPALAATCNTLLSAC